MTHTLFPERTDQHNIRHNKRSKARLDSLGDIFYVWINACGLSLYLVVQVRGEKSFSRLSDDWVSKVFLFNMSERLQKGSWGENTKSYCCCCCSCFKLHFIMIRYQGIQLSRVKEISFLLQVSFSHALSFGNFPQGSAGERRKKRGFNCSGAQWAAGPSLRPMWTRTGSFIRRHVYIRPDFDIYASALSRQRKMWPPKHEYKQTSLSRGAAFVSFNIPDRNWLSKKS